MSALSGLGPGAKRPEKLLRELRNEQPTGFTSTWYGASVSMFGTHSLISASLGNPGRFNPLSGMRLLLVDDSRKTFEMFASVLRLESCEVDTAYGGIDALRLLQHRRYDVLVSDLGMPEISGFDLMTTVRQLNLTHMPIPIALSAYTQEAEAQRALSVGFDKHLAKPTSVAKFKTAVASLRCTTRSGPRGRCSEPRSPGRLAEPGEAGHRDLL